MSESYAFCQQVAKYRAGNFYYSFLMLPRPQRQAMCALYAFMRVADDLADEPAPVPAKRAALERWRIQLEAGLAGERSDPVTYALAHAVDMYGISRAHLHALMDGVTMDLEPQRFEDWSQLRRYCYHVASAVGLCCTRIWGGDGVRSDGYAESAGIAFQLTNILRDVATDSDQGRVYLPRDLLDSQGCTYESVLRREWDRSLLEVLRVVAGRAEQHYREAEPLNDHLPSAGRAVWGVMYRTYYGLLRRLETQQFDPRQRRPQTSRWTKLGLLLRAVPVRLGWKEAV